MPRPRSMSAGQVPSSATVPVSPPWTAGRASSPLNRIVILPNQFLHIAGVPLVLLGLCLCGFLLVYLKGVLLPFVVSVFIVYLLRPTVNLLTTPFSSACWCCVPGRQHQAVVTSRRNGHARYSRLQPDPPGSDDATPLQAQQQPPPQHARRARPATPPKYPRTLKAYLSRALQSAQEAVSIAARGPIVPGGANNSTGLSAVPSQMTSGSSVSVGTAGLTISAAAAGSVPGSAAPSPTHISTHQEDECGCCCGPCRMTRCPRWFGILVALGFSALVISGLVLLIVDAVQRFQHDSLEVYINQAGKLADAVQRGFLAFGVSLDAGMILEVLKQQAPPVEIVRGTLTIAVDSFGNALLVLLVVLYLLAEHSTHAPGSLRAKVDSQIQRYVVIKTAISAMQGLLVYIVMGYMLNVRMSHLFAVAHFLLNYIPTAGPIIATALPLPVVILDPELTVAAKIAAFAGPTFIHMVIGNVVEPMVFGQSMELHPVTVLLALALWYALWGIPGAILAVPITAVLRIVLVALDHPYASIAISLMEGRLTAATAELDYAIESAAGPMAASMQSGAGDIDLEALSATPLNAGGQSGAAALSPSRDDAVASEWRYRHYGPTIDGHEEADASQTGNLGFLPVPPLPGNPGPAYDDGRILGSEQLPDPAPASGQLPRI